jgi:hypothetical protein
MRVAWIAGNRASSVLAAVRRGDAKTMPKKLKNIDRFIDRHGKPRHYYRCGRGRRVRLAGEPGSPEFMQAYRAAAAEVALRVMGQGVEPRDERAEAQVGEPPGAVRP